MNRKSPLKRKRMLRSKKKYSGYGSGERKPGEKPKDFKGTVSKFLPLLRPFLPGLILVVITGMIGAVLNVTGPMLLGDIVDAIKQQADIKLAGGKLDFAQIRKVLLTILAIYGTSSVLSYIQHYTMAGITQSVVRSLREKVNDKLTHLPLKYIDTHSKGDILSRMMNDIDNISNTLQNNLVQIITSAVSFIGMLGLMFYVSWQLTLITLSVLPPSLLIISRIAKRSKRYFRRQWDETGELNGHVEEMYTGHNLIKVFDHEKQAIEEFDDINVELTKVSYKAQFISGMISPILGFVSNIAYVLICVIGGIYVISGTLTLGDITTFFTYSKLFMQPLVDIGNIANRLQSSLASAERVFALLDEEVEIEDSYLCRIEEPKGAVTFEDVCFSYTPDVPLIEHMDLSVEPGQLVAIVGPTGAGKTTFVNLLMRFYDVTSGRILLDGCDIRDIPRENLRSIFGMVLQDTWLFEGTIMDNISYGRENCSREEVMEAAKAARVSHFINTLPDGYETVLEENGENISQGQRQLLTIARAILADPAVLILDEATSSVDTRTEIHIQKAMKNLMNGRTSFVIAHRLSTIRDADVILVMNDGKIVEHGKHDELLAANGFYSELYRSQFGV
ncbi:MAG: ABC transporter ATP-binding protein [Clostridia bacterium]|nr:ABC transporter ATP-binding protein [Clostridia bacterium]